jgi:hypothetical protein
MARGAMNFYNNPYLSAGYSKAREGMSMIRPIDIPRGQVLYRFYDASKARSPEEGADGPWWLEYEHFQTIKHFALRNGYSLSYAARLFAAILYEWSEVNAWVSCEVTQPLHAWKGRGKQVRSSGKDSRDLPTMTPMQSVLEVYQIVLPGVGGKGSIASKVLKAKASDKF